jgi:hypothetical protein
MTIVVGKLERHARRSRGCVDRLTISDIRLTSYTLRSEQYEAVVSRRDDGDRKFAFVMPPMCAVCCSREAPFVATRCKKGWWHALEYERGSVRFASYPYYQEFCALNHISEGGIAASQKASPSGPPQAVARLRDERPEDRNSSSQ